MIRHWLSATALLAAALLLTPATGLAQARFGVSVGGPRGGFYYNTAPYYGYNYYGYNYYPGYYYRPYYPGYAYGSYYYPRSYYYNTYNYVPPATTSQSYYFTPGSSTAVAQSAPDAVVAETNRAALVDVYVPTPDAEVWFGDTLMRQTGTTRQFASPPLNPGRSYTYRITARWVGPDGQPVVRARDVIVQPSSRVTVDFTRPG